MNTRPISCPSAWFIAATLLTLAVLPPARASAPTVSAAPADVAKLYLAAFLRNRSDAVGQLMDYLHVGQNDIAPAELVDLPDTLVAVVRVEMLQHTSGPEAERNGSVAAVTDALRAALQRTDCQVNPGTPPATDRYRIAVAFTCAVPATRDVMGYMSDAELKGGKAAPAAHFAAADAIRKVTSVVTVTGTLPMYSTDGITWTAGEPEDLLHDLVTATLAR